MHDSGLMTAITPDRAARQGGRVSPASGGMALLYSLSPGALWRVFQAQRLSFWLLCLAMLFEYVRPQAIYTWMEGIPWSQILLILAPILFVLEGGAIRVRNAMTPWLLAFGAAVLLSSVLAIHPDVSWADLYVFGTWILFYLLIASLANTEPKFLLFYLLYMLASFKMSQHGFRTWLERGFGFADWGATGAPGWFQNSGEFGIQMCIFLPLTLYLLVALKPYLSRRAFWLMSLLPLTAMASIIASNSRGALLGIAAVGLWLLLRTRYRVRVLLGLAVAAVLVLNLTPPETRERFTTIGTDKTSASRKEYWRHGIELFRQYPVTGIGYENWKRVYPERWGRVALPHNIFIQAGAELGSVGLLTLFGLIVSSFVVNYRTRRMAAELGDLGRFMGLTARGLDAAMIGFLVSGFFITVLFYPFLWFNLAMTAAVHESAKGAPRVSGRAPLAPSPRGERSPGWRSARSQAARTEQVWPPPSPALR